MWTALYPAARRGREMTWPNREKCVYVTYEVILVRTVSMSTVDDSGEGSCWGLDLRCWRGAKLCSLESRLAWQEDCLWRCCGCSRPAGFPLSRQADELDALGKFVTFHLWVPVFRWILTMSVYLLILFYELFINAPTWITLRISKKVHVTGAIGYLVPSFSLENYCHCIVVVNKQ